MALDSGPGRVKPRLERCLVLARLGEHAVAVAVAKTLVEQPKVTAEVLTDAAAVYAAASAQVKNDEPLKEQCAARAVQLLRQALTKGYKDVDRLRNDAEFEPLRQRPDFKQLLQQSRRSDAESRRHLAVRGASYAR